MIDNLGNSCMYVGGGGECVLLIAERRLFIASSLYHCWSRLYSAVKDRCVQKNISTLNCTAGAFGCEGS